MLESPPEIFNAIVDVLADRAEEQNRQKLRDQLRQRIV